MQMKVAYCNAEMSEGVHSQWPQEEKGQGQTAGNVTGDYSRQNEKFQS